MTWALHNAECVEFMRGIGNKSVGVTLCDPPYFAQTDKGFRSGSAPDEYRGFGFKPLTIEEARELAGQYARITKRWTIIFSDDYGGRVWPDILAAAGLEYIRTGIWVRKGAPQMCGDRPACGWEPILIAHAKGKKHWNGGGKDAVWQFPIVQGRGRCHPTQKPLDLMRALVGDFTDPGELIFDSHAGSGTTGVACIELGRDFQGCERDATHYATAHERLTNTARQEVMFARPMKQERLGL